MRRLGGRYLVGEPLGAGGMGSIFRGHDERLGQAVAIKILKPALLDDPILRERFRREALALARLRHPGIVTVLDFGESDGDLYTVLELVSGRSLAQTLHESKGGRIAVVRAARIIDQILAALEVCHDHAVVHRDVKPANVMISADSAGERATLIDFGLARMARFGDGSIATLTETGAVQGTPQYMAPEQCRGEEVGPASDVYSVGVVFYEMLAGAGPFRGDDAATAMAQHLFVEPIPLAVAAPTVSAGFAAVVHAALEKRPVDRPSPRDLRAALAGAVAGTDPEAVAAASAALRHRVGHLPRSERALGGAAPTADVEVNPEAGVLLWMPASARADALRSCLGAARIANAITHGAGIPALDGYPVVVVSAEDGLGRIQDLVTSDAKVCVIAVDVSTPAQTTEAIRSGASDMLLKQAADTDLVAKVRRLLRRRARR